MGCWLAEHGVFYDGVNEIEMPPCSGGLVRVHLIPRGLIKQKGGNPLDWRSYVMACGGPIGNGGHHGHLDYSRRLRVPRSALAETGVEELALELRLGWFLDRHYP